MPDRARRSIALVGLSGSGKSTVGACVAVLGKRLGDALAVTVTPALRGGASDERLQQRPQVQETFQLGPAGDQRAPDGLVRFGTRVREHECATMTPAADG